MFQGLHQQKSLLSFSLSFKVSVLLLSFLCVCVGSARQAMVASFLAQQVFSLTVCPLIPSPPPPTLSNLLIFVGERETERVRKKVGILWFV